MKTNRLLQLFFLVVTSAFFSCGSEDSSGENDNNGNENGNGNQITSITISSNLSTIQLGNSITFTVKSNLNTDLTSESSIQVNGTTIEGNSFTPESSGNYTFKASYENFNTSESTFTVTPVIVSINIAANAETINIGDTIEYTITGIDSEENAHDLTESSTVYINDNESFTKNQHIPSQVGNIEAYATNGNLTSPVINVTIEDTETTPTAFTKKTLITDFTGTWCGWCPRVSRGIELVEEQTNNVAVIAVHLANGDPYQNSFGTQLANSYGFGGNFPEAIINKSDIWEYPEPNNIEQVLSFTQGTSASGISINSTVDGRNVSVFVSVGFGQDVTGAKLAIMLLENELYHNQENYTNYYNGVDPIFNFQHDNVIRYSVTDINGDNIPGEEVANNMYRTKYDFTLPIGAFEDTNNAEIVALLLDSNGQIINTNFAEIGVDKDFD